MEGGGKMAVVLYLEMRSTHRARRTQRGEGLSVGQERREEVSRDAGGHPGGGAGRQSQVRGRGRSWNTDQAVLRGVATADAMRSWPRLATGGCSGGQAVVPFPLDVEFSQKSPQYDDASQERCCFSPCALPPSPPRNDFCSFHSEQERRLHCGGSFRKDGLR